MRIVPVALIASVGLALAACGSTDSAPSSSAAADESPPVASSSAPAVTPSTSPSAEVPAPSPTPSATASAVAVEYATLDELLGAYLAAGGTCPEFEQDNEVDAARESGNCGDSGVLMLFDDSDGAKAQAETLMGLFEDTGIPGAILVGGNWILNVDDHDVVLSAMGGEVLTAGEPSAAGATESAPVEEPPVIEAGTWLVPSEIKPGVYRVAGYYARLDSDGEIIDNDGVYGENDLTLMVVKKSDDMVEVSGEALAIEFLPRYDPLRNGATSGTYLVGKDIKPGRYRVKDPDYAYAARLDKDLDIIDNAGNEGNVVITIKPSDYAFEFSGELSRL